MGTLSSCLKKIGLSKHEAAILRGATDDNIKDGDEAHVAAVRAVADYIEQLEKERAGIVAQVEKQGGVAPDAAFKLADLADLTRVLRKGDETAYTEPKQPEKNNVTTQPISDGVEQDRQDSGAADGLGAQGVQDERQPNGTVGGDGVSGRREGERFVGGTSADGRKAAPVGERGPVALQGDESGLSDGAAGSDDGGRGGATGFNGSPVESITTESSRQAATSGTELKSAVEAQAEANLSGANGEGIEGIRAALPILKPLQQEDVAKAEARFAKDDGYGMLFTNGTGTGKTWIGLGMIRRMLNAGKRNILVVTPSQEIIRAWVGAAKFFGIDAQPIKNTKDAGTGVSLTTFNNFGANDALATRNWDFVIMDEAHRLVANEDGEPTRALHSLRAITQHPDGINRRHEMLNGKEIAELKALDAMAKSQRLSDDERHWYEATATQAKADALRKELDDKLQALRAETASAQGPGRTRTLFLSASPFAWDKTIEWGNGYLFDYNEGRGDESREFRGYNVGSNKDQFFMQHLGWRMRTGKLTEPDAKVNRSLMQRQFNAWLKQRGVLSGRMLEVDNDYDRRFIMIDSAVGKRIDEALDWFGERNRSYSEAKDKSGGIGSYQSDPYTMALHAVHDAIYETFKLHHNRMFLLEAIKAKASIEHIREHLDHGHKVVVVHDFNNGDNFTNPFDVSSTTMPNDATDEQAERVNAWNRVVSEFRSEFADLISSPDLQGSSLLDTFKEEFPEALFFNGTITNDQIKAAAIRKFNDDASGPVLLVANSAAIREGVSLHDTTGKFPRVMFNLGMPTQPTAVIQLEGRVYREGQKSDAMLRYLNTGTRWEEYAFASKIAVRADTAENLGMGDAARTLRDSFIDAFNESSPDYRAGMEGEGKGGKEKDRAGAVPMTDFERAKSFYFGQQKKTSQNKAAEGADYFATPEPVGLKMVEFADIRGGNKVLEPSAGHGAIARWFPENADARAIEPSGKLIPKLAMAFPADNIIQGDFESHNVVNKYDAIVMNPPFGTGGKLAIEHLAKAATHLNDGGRIVALLPAGPMADKRLDKFLYEEEERKLKPLLQHPKLGDIYRGALVKTSAGWAPEGKLLRAASTPGSYWIKPEGKAETIVYPDQLGEIVEQGPKTESFKPAADLQMIADIKLPGVTFERAGTSVMTHIVVLEKQTDAAKASDTRGVYNRDLSRVEDIAELFDSLENMALPSRPQTEAEIAAEKAEAEAPAKPKRGERPAKAEKPAVDMAAAQAQAQAEGLDIIEYTTKKGKVLKGVIRKDLTQAQAKEIDPYTWKMDGGYFIRAEHMSSQAYKDSLGGDTPTTLSAAPAGNNRDAAIVVDSVAANDAITAAMSGLKNAPPVTLVDSFHELPQQVQDEAKEQDAGEREFKGALKAGHIWILRANHSTVEDIEATLFHELYGHYGTRALFGNKWMQEINKLFASVGGWNGIKDIAAKRGIDLESYRKGVLNWEGDKKIWREPVMMEELLAHIAEQQPNAKLSQRIMDGIKRLVGQFRQWLRDHGFAKLEKRGETDLLHLLSQAAQAVREGKSVLSGPAMTVMRSEEPQGETINVDGVERPRLNSEGRQIHPTEDGIRNFWRWFGDSKVVDAKGRPVVQYHGTRHDVDEFKDEHGRGLNKIQKLMRSLGFDPNKGDFFFAADPEFAGSYAGVQGMLEGGNVVPAYLSIKNPASWSQQDNKGMSLMSAITKAKKDGHDGIHVSAWNEGAMKRFDGSYSPIVSDVYIAFDNRQIKSSVGNNGNFDPNEAPIMMRRSAGDFVADHLQDAAPKVSNWIRDLFGGDSAKTFGVLHKTISSQFHKAKIDADYRRVYNRAQSFIEDVARYGSEAADLAPDLLPKMDTVSGALRGLKNAKADKADVEAISAPIFDGTLYEDDQGNTGKVWSDEELRRHYNLSDRQIELYRQFRLAVDQSLEALAVAEMNKAARANELEAPKAGLGMRALSKFYRDQYLDELNELRQEYDRLSAAYDENDNELKLNAERNKATREQYFEAKTQMHADYATKQRSLMARIEELEAMEKAFLEKVKTITKLQNEGYAPLMRFGKYSVDVVEQRPMLDDDGQPIIDADTGEMMMQDEHVFFSMFETEAEAREAERVMAEEYPNATVSRGVVSEAGWQLFQGTNIDSLKLLADLVGAEDEAVQRFYKHAVSSRSALKRLIHRKGTAGYSKDVSRSLASFLLTNARAAASADHMGDLVEAANDIPKSKGDVKDEAVRLIDYIRNPNEEAGLWRGMLFVQFLGGSISSAAINLTQTMTTTIPFLHQYGASLGDVAGAAKLAGAHMAGKKEGLSQSLQDALHLAESEGVLQPHNIHALMGASGVQAMQHSRLARVLSSVWGSFFGMAEQYNRQTAFIAAYNLAEKMGQSGLWQAWNKQAELNAGRGLPPPSRDVFASPFAFAKNAVDETQFVLSKAARPNFARGIVGSTFMTFKTFSIFSLELFKRLPNKERAMMLGILIALAGVGGLPFSDDGDDLIDTLGQAMGYNTNSKQWRTNAAKEIFGDLGGTFFTEGVSAFLPLELQTRLSMGNLIPASGLLKRSNSANMDGQMMELLGPSGGLLKQMTDAWSYLQRGEVGQAITQGIAPKAIKDIAKGIDMAATGAYTDAKGRRIVDTNGLDAFLKSIGFQPRSVSTVRETQAMLMQDKSMVQNVQKAISEVWAAGIHERDAAKVQRARELLADWNAKNPDTPIQIKRANIQRRANEMGKTASERMLKAMPAGMKAKAAAELEN